MIFFALMLTWPILPDAKVDMSKVSSFMNAVYSAVLTIRPQIQLTAEDLYDKEKVDLETIEVDDVFKLLQSSEEGLSAEEAQRRLELFGPNKLESKAQNPFLQVKSHV